jgi:hypothetical protein
MTASMPRSGRTGGPIIFLVEGGVPSRIAGSCWPPRRHAKPGRVPRDYFLELSFSRLGPPSFTVHGRRHRIRGADSLSDRRLDDSRGEGTEGEIAETIALAIGGGSA